MKTHKQTATELVEKYLDVLNKNFPRKSSAEYNFLAQQSALIDIEGKIELLAEINNKEAFNVSHYANELQIIKREIENL
jgi:hypothetical protein